MKLFGRCPSEVCPYGSSMSRILQQMLEIVTLTAQVSSDNTAVDSCSMDEIVGCHELEKIISSCDGSTRPFIQAMSMLRICPLSLALHALVGRFSSLIVDSNVVSAESAQEADRQDFPFLQAAKKKCDNDEYGQDCLGLHEEKMIIEVVGQVLTIVRLSRCICESLRFSLIGLARSLAVIQYGPCTGWRAQALVCSLILALLPTKDIAHDLLVGLPHPDLALIRLAEVGPVQGGSDEEKEHEDRWSVPVAKLLSNLLMLSAPAAADMAKRSGAGA